MNNKNSKIKSAYALKRGTYATVFTAVFIALVIGINILFTALSSRFPISLDLYSDMRNTLSAENVDYIESIEKEIKIYVAGMEDDFSSQGYVALFAEDQDVYDEKGYYQQTATLLKEYPKHNSNIEVRFLDITSKDFEAIAKNYSGYSMGDLFVECTFQNEAGEEVVRRKLVSFKDMYSYEDTTGYGYRYSITGSRLENALASAMYSVTLEKTITLGVPVEYCEGTSSFMQYLADELKGNNYHVVEIEGLDIKEFSSDLDGILVYNPKLDFTTEMIDALDVYLDNDGKKGKAFYYFPSDTTVDRHNINEFLEEWGMTYMNKNGQYYTLYDDINEEYDILKGVCEYNTEESGYTDSTDTMVSKTALSKYTLAMDRIYETYVNRTTNVVMKSTSNATLRPVGALDDWKPAKDAEKGSYATLIVTADTNAADRVSSFVVGFASSTFASTEFNSDQWRSVTKNLDVIIELFNETTGQESAPFSFTSKKINIEYFKPENAAVVTVRVIFIFVLTLLVIGSGIFVWVWRKNR